MKLSLAYLLMSVLHKMICMMLYSLKVETHTHTRICVNIYNDFFNLHWFSLALPVAIFCSAVMLCSPSVLPSCQDFIAVLFPFLVGEKYWRGRGAFSTWLYYVSTTVIGLFHSIIVLVSQTHASTLPSITYWHFLCIMFVSCQRGLCVYTRDSQAVWSISLSTLTNHQAYWRARYLSY